MKRKHLIAGFVLIALMGTGAAAASFVAPREAVEFFIGHHHTHDGETVGAPEHSGGLDRYGTDATTVRCPITVIADVRG